MISLDNLFFKGVNLFTSVLDGSSTGLLTSKEEGGVKIVRRAGTMDRFVVWEVWRYHQYDIPGFEINSNDTVLDIGAQIGSFSVYAAKKAYLGKVYSFEALKENYELLTRNKKINNLSNLKIFNNAVSDKSGFSSFYSSDFNTGGHSMTASRRVNLKTSVKVKTISLEDILEKNKIKKVDYLKIDIEGGEYKVILRTPKKVLERVKKIVMETHRFPEEKHKPEEIRDYLRKNSFSVKMRKYPFPLKIGNLYAKRA